MRRRLLPFLAIALIATACSQSRTDADPPTTSTGPTSTIGANTTPPAGRPPRCDVQWEQEPVGIVASRELDEISGAVVSRQHPGVIWVHNDSGNDAAVFALDTTGTDRGRVDLPDLSARDWEDMALGPGPDPALDYLYLGDIGDNNERRDHVLIHRVPEPTPEPGVRTGGETLQITYPLGPMQAETLLVDPVTGDIVIAGQALSGVTALYGLAGTVNWAVSQEATYLGEIMLGTFAAATGGEAGTNQIVIRTYDEVFTWQRRPGESIAEALFTPGCRLASIEEAQGEAIALAPDELSFYTVSEGDNQPIHRYAAAS